MNIISPLSGTNNVVLESILNTDEICSEYKYQFQIDVSDFFKGISKIYLYKCLDTNYRFYYPFTLSGDTHFYEQLQKFPWYYMEWKWEHEICLQYLKKGSKVLEIGCAQGSFINKASLKGIQTIGLELNAKAANEGKNKGLNIFTESIQEHALKFPNEYDVVCSFQVMEHISEIKQVIDASIQVLKPGGMFIMSVPNNDSFLGLDKNYLNMPPHHMGLWNEKSLKSLEKIFNLKLIEIQLEPLQPYHKEYFAHTLANYISKKLHFLPGTKRICLKVIPKVIGLFSKKIKAYTIQAVYEKKHNQA